jgi:hypothetical protein
LLTERRIRRGVDRSVAALQAAIQDYIDHHNADPKPFRWTKSADRILEAIERCRVRNTQTINRTNFRSRTLGGEPTSCTACEPHAGTAAGPRVRHSTEAMIEMFNRFHTMPLRKAAW